MKKLFVYISLIIFPIFLYSQSEEERRVTDEVRTVEQPSIKSVEEVDSLINEKMEQASRLLEESQKAYQEGEYNKSFELSQKVRNLTDEIENLQLQKSAILKIDEAKKEIETAESAEAQNYAPEELANAKSSFLLAQNNLTENKFNEAIINAEEAIRYAKNAKLKTEERKRAEEEAKLAKKEELPATEIKVSKDGKYKIWKTYTVRLIPHRRDCLWRIAEYDFIYNNPWKWPIIYKANKHQIKDPDLIYPGQVFDIPELDENGNPVLVETIEIKEKSVETKEKSGAEIHEQPPFEK
jgi:hypothetical protein